MQAFFPYDLTFIPFMPPMLIVAQCNPDEIERKANGEMHVDNIPWYVMSAN